MKEKNEIVDNWLPRYTGVPLDQFGEHILLTNFGGYLNAFSQLTGAPIVGLDRPMASATIDGISMINFGMGSPNAATMMDLLSAIMPKAVLFLGKCGGLDYWTGTVYTTNRRVWEHDVEFKEYLRKVRCMAIDMETATIFSAGFANRIPCGALLLVSDQPMVPEGVKTEASDAQVSSQFVIDHINIGIEALKLIRRNGKSVRHLRFDE
ncbi:MAG: AMP nucleosidase [Lysobacteraceae bacterium]|nr:MAG: AMP nucleosidase [Xanthomonadaceae bacterium]